MLAVTVEALYQFALKPWILKLDVPFWEAFKVFVFSANLFKAF